jgi:hypothetical protein
MAMIAVFVGIGALPLLAHVGPGSEGFETKLTYPAIVVPAEP